ncbi:MULTISPECIES: ABC transporter ATP-binding protein [unclassified Modestobacter]|uniref:ABC transporter ATP-binding protein n=1 Tax=unclassified Modestobacter TaxID=2643866 RepID=UPI0022AABE0B|nr:MULTISPECIES: ATP-binding cassette domain-containing protein [unclassified Modestobacter]MCZ2825910.1 ATP-binding cassette domain-containing protein [Modestobacter sp. VKM Ac-2981]MCZ2853025.1 ATP-binding cassette domain-containing protein [Modestobacter sp. VKM Ac-2982]
MITIEHLTKRYGAQVAVSDVSFACQPGTVTGFLGPNGAGKSTTMRALVGLASPTSGTATFDGKHYRELPNAGRQVGVLLDAGAQHAGRTGRETLTLAAMVLGVGHQRVDEVLGLVGLAGRPAGKRLGNYSLGMRQRLGLATALLGDPQVLVLDEPANGLDPEGIFWMRGLLRGFADRGGTVLLSSHLLHEVEAVADQLVVIAGGRIAAQGSKSELLAGTGGTLVRGPDRALLAKALDAAGISVSSGPDDALVADADALAVGQAVAAAGVVLTELRAAGGAGLEDLFRSLTGSSHQVQEVQA